MRSFAETLEILNSRDASPDALFEGTRRVRRRATVQEMERVHTFIRAVERGQVSRVAFQEVMTTSDFPLLFGDTLDRQLLGEYRATTPMWRQLFRQSRVNDFREAARYAVDGADGQLERVPQASEYPEAALTEAKDTLSVAKYGRRISLTWEDIINDDLGAFDNLPRRLARGAVRSEEKFATGILFDANGPHASLYNAGFGNIIPGNPELSQSPAGIAALQAGFDHLATQVDEEGEPIVFDLVYLVVPPALEQIGRNLLSATELRLVDAGSNSQLVVNNWMRNRVQLVVLPYIPSVVTGTPANANTSWLLMGSPADSRPVVEFAHLRGYEEPSIYTQAPTARSIGGGDVLESFENDTYAYRVRHVWGGTRLVNTGKGRGTVASNGSGSDS